MKKDKTSSSYDLGEQMQYLYVRVVKARDIAIFDGVELVAEVKLGNYSKITKTAPLGNTEWDQVFEFSKEYCIQSSTVEINVKDRYEENHMGRVWFDLSNVPSRVPEDSQLAPQWYKMEDKTSNKAKTGELMVSVWFGTKYDEAFAQAWNSPKVPFDALNLIESKVYHSPKLWYLRVSVIEAEHIMPGHKGSQVVRFPEFCAKVQVGNRCLRTKIAAPSATRSFSNPFWNEDLLFVAEEPFVNSISVWVEDQVGQEPFVNSMSSWVEDQVGPRSNAAVPMVELPLATIEKRFDERRVTSSWFDLKSHCGKAGNNNRTSTRFVPRIHLRVSFDGGYHVFDGDTTNISDVRPTEASLWKPHIGVLEMRILGASGLLPVKKNSSEERALLPVKKNSSEERAANAYCVAKYGPKWFRTRTVVDSLSPKWNEQYRWEVYDLCTVMTIGVFDNRRIVKNVGASDSDSGIGKVRITLSKLETDRVYTHSYPLLMVYPLGVKKMGELHLRIRISCSNVANMLLMYTTPLLPKMHYADPLPGKQSLSLELQAMDLLAKRLSKEEPPLGMEVVGYMHGREMWNLRKSRANFNRLFAAFSGLIAMRESLEAIRDWKKPAYSTLFLIIFLTLVMLPKFILPIILSYLAFMGLWSYSFRPQYPSQACTRLSCADLIHPDELDEEFDTFPTSRAGPIVRMRYDRLRSMASRIQHMMGDTAVLLERLEALLSWTDPRATFLFLVLCLIAAVGLYFVPIRVVIALFGLYSLRPPRFRSTLPSIALNFFRRLPTAEGCSEGLEWINNWTCLSVLIFCLRESCSDIFIS